MRGYREDLAYIHDAGFSWYSLKAAPGLLALLRRHRINDGLVVDLACGSGRWALELTRAGYDVVGIDLSPAMIQLARARAPKAAFRTGSLLSARIPPCRAVTALGECLNYQFDSSASRNLAPFFAHIYRALEPGGVFLFDVAEPERVPETTPRQYWFAGSDWAMLVAADGSRKRAWLTRDITTFRKVGKLYRRSQEIHRLQLFRASEVAEQLSRAGFQVRVLRAYGRFPLLPGMAAFVAWKPARIAPRRRVRRITPFTPRLQF